MAAKKSVYEIVTEQIVKQLEAGVVPWEKPWVSSGAGWRPINLATNKQYRGVNVVLLACAGFDSPYWVTYKQAQKLGGQVRKGERSTPVTFWKIYKKEVEQDDGTVKTEKRFILRYYRVFNVEQCDGLEDRLPPAAKVELPETNSDDLEADQWAAELIGERLNGLTLTTGSGQAYYSPAEDRVNLPGRERFHDSAGWFATLFHEMTHATGHHSRLSRLTQTARFGDNTYSKEELVAELGGAFLCAEAGIITETIERSTAYLQSWIKVLKGDFKLVVHAAAAAEKAVALLV